MKRCTLHRKKLGEFTAWCAEHGYETRAGKGDFEVLQVYYKGHYLRIWDRHNGDHYTVENTLIPLIRKYIETRNTGKRKAASPAKEA